MSQSEPNPKPDTKFQTGAVVLGTTTVIAGAACFLYPPCAATAWAYSMAAGTYVSTTATGLATSFTGVSLIMPHL
jgi:hypothetical protein